MLAAANVSAFPYAAKVSYDQLPDRSTGRECAGEVRVARQDGTDRVVGLDVSQRHDAVSAGNIDRQSRRVAYAGQNKVHIRAVVKGLPTAAAGKRKGDNTAVTVDKFFCYHTN